MLELLVPLSIFSLGVAVGVRAGMELAGRYAPCERAHVVEGSSGVGHIEAAGPVKPDHVAAEIAPPNPSTPPPDTDRRAA